MVRFVFRKRVPERTTVRLKRPYVLVSRFAASPSPSGSKRELQSHSPRSVKLHLTTTTVTLSRTEEIPHHPRKDKRKDHREINNGDQKQLTSRAVRTDTRKS